MKAFKFPTFGLELTTIVRYSAIFDVFRFLLILGPMIAVFHACINVNPKFPHLTNGITADYVLYDSHRVNLSNVEGAMLYRVQKSCGKEYRNNLPQIWTDAQPTLFKALYLEAAAVILPVVSAVLFLVFQKRDMIASLAAVLHFTFEILSICFGLFASWFISDKRLCFLGYFAASYSVPGIFWSLTIISAVTYKAAVLYALDQYIRFNCKNVKTYYRPPSPSEELKAYLKEMKSMGVAPNVNIDLPHDPSKRDWVFVESQIKRILQEVRIQMAELHKDDPLVHDLLKSGKLHGKRRASSYTPNVLKIARMMTSESAEYKLLKQHKHKAKNDREGKDEMEIILPEPDLRFVDPDRELADG